VWRSSGRPSGVAPDRCEDVVDGGDGSCGAVLVLQEAHVGRVDDLVDAVGVDSAASRFWAADQPWVCWLSEAVRTASGRLPNVVSAWACRKRVGRTCHSSLALRAPFALAVSAVTWSAAAVGRWEEVRVAMTRPSPSRLSVGVNASTRWRTSYWVG
jgi:hypothetical protein